MLDSVAVAAYISLWKYSILLPLAHSSHNMHRHTYTQASRQDAHNSSCTHGTRLSSAQLRTARRPSLGNGLSCLNWQFYFTLASMLSLLLFSVCCSLLPKLPVASNCEGFVLCFRGGLGLLLLHPGGKARPLLSLNFCDLRKVFPKL